MRTTDKINEYFDSEYANIKNALGYTKRNSGIGTIHFDNDPISGYQKEMCHYVANDCDPSVHEDLKSILRNSKHEQISYAMTDSARAHADNLMASLMRKGVSKEDATEQVNDSMEQMLQYDKNNDRFVKTASVKGEQFDSIIEGATQPWNVGYLNRIIRQPYMETRADMLWKKESFSNPFAEKVVLAKASFEGFGRLSSAKGNFKQNTSAPTSSEVGSIYADVYNLSIDYQSDYWENLKAAQKGNWIAPQVIAQRERYTKYMLDLSAAVYRLYGDEDGGMVGLLNATEPILYGGTPLYNVINSASATKGAEVLNTIKRLVFDFLRETNFMAKEVKILCSTYMYQCLCQPTYSDQFDASAPVEKLHFAWSSADILNGSKVFKITICPDKLCDPRTPFNPTDEDLFIMAIPEIEDALGNQGSLILAGEPLSGFIVPALWSRNGILYSYYKRITDILAPVDGSLRVYKGVAVQG